MQRPDNDQARFSNRRSLQQVPAGLARRLAEEKTSWTLKGAQGLSVTRRVALGHSEHQRKVSLHTTTVVLWSCRVFSHRWGVLSLFFGKLLRSQGTRRGDAHLRAAFGENKHSSAAPKSTSRAAECCLAAKLPAGDGTRAVSRSLVVSLCGPPAASAWSAAGCWCR